MALRWFRFGKQQDEQAAEESAATEVAPPPEAPLPEQEAAEQEDTESSADRPNILSSSRAPTVMCTHSTALWAAFSVLSASSR